MSNTPTDNFLAKFWPFSKKGKNPPQGKGSFPTAEGGKTAKSQSSDQAIIKQIVTEAKDLSLKEIQSWRTSLLDSNDAEKPRWSTYQDLLDYLDPDAQLGTSIDIRVAATLGKDYMIASRKTGKEVREKTDILKHKEWFFNFVWNFLDTIFKGYTAAQLVDPVTMEFFYIPRRNIVPQKDFLLFNTTEDTGISLKDPSIADRVIIMKYKKLHGILNDIVPNLIWKKNSRQAWQEFSEKFGIPPIWATTNKRDKETIDRIETMLKQLAEASTAVLPEGTTITVQDDTTKGDPYNTWLKQIELDDQQIAKRILGGTMITDSGSSRSQSEVHERTLKEVISLFDNMLIIWLVNDYLMPMMSRFGYPFTEDDVFRFKDTNELTLPEHWKIVESALQHYEIDQNWIADTFNIPIIGKKETSSLPFNNPAIAPAEALAGTGIYLPSYKHSATSPVAIGVESILEELSLTLINDIWAGNSTLVSEVLKSIEGHKTLLDGLLNGWKSSSSLSYDGLDNRCLAAMEYNIFEFSRLKEKSNAIVLSQLLLNRDENNIREFTDFRDKALSYLKNPDMNWLRTEFNHAVAVGQGSSRYWQFMEEANSITEWGVIRTAGDSQVRKTHKVLEGKKVSFRNGGPSVWVPFDIGCRCDIEQHLGDVNDSDIVNDNDILKAIGKSQNDKWTGNRAKTGQVFAQNEMYMRDGFGVESISYKAYGQPSYDQIKDKLKLVNLDGSINNANKETMWKPEAGKNYMHYEDYQGRKMKVTRSVFDRQTAGRFSEEKEQRHRIYGKIKDVLSDPSEVYIFKYQKAGKLEYQTNYIRFYKDKAIVVNTGVGNSGIEINSWYFMTKEEATRNGYLIHKKKP